MGAVALKIPRKRQMALDDGIQLAVLWASGNAATGWTVLRSWPPARARRAAMSLADVAEILTITICYMRGLRTTDVKPCEACNAGPDGERAAAVARAILDGLPDENGHVMTARTLHDSVAIFGAAGLACFVAALMCAEHGAAACERLLALDLFLTKDGQR